MLQVNLYTILFLPLNYWNSQASDYDHLVGVNDKKNGCLNKTLILGIKYIKLLFLVLKLRCRTSKDKKKNIQEENLGLIDFAVEIF